jgi:hypothetical protein
MNIDTRTLIGFLVGLSLGLFMLVRYLDSQKQTGFEHDSCAAFQRDGRRLVDVENKKPWQVFKNIETGDVNVMPVGEEEHDFNPKCRCVPRVDMEGSKLVIVHNAFDHREIVEQAVSILNGVDWE